MLVDWVSGFVECPAWAKVGYLPYDTGQVLVREPDGSIRRIGTGKVLHEGSFDSRITVASTQGHNLYLSGNPVKHIQGHNLFGSADAVGLFLEAGLRIRESVGLFPSAETWLGNEFEGPRFTRIDLTRSYRFESVQAARAWIRSVAANARSRHGAALFKGDTVYLGKESERWTFKVYNKLDELMSRKKGHKLSRALEPSAQAALLDWAEGVVRFELTLRSKELVGLNLTPETTQATWQHYYDRITWNRNAEMATAPDMLEAALTPRLRMALMAWRAGNDLRALHSKSAFYRMRQELLETVGIDIAVAPPSLGEVSTRASLDPAGWDPEPLDAHMHSPDPELKKQYGLL